MEMCGCECESRLKEELKRLRVSMEAVCALRLEQAGMRRREAEASWAVTRVKLNTAFERLDARWSTLIDVMKVI